MDHSALPPLSAWGQGREGSRRKSAGERPLRRAGSAAVILAHAAMPHANTHAATMSPFPGDSGTMLEQEGVSALPAGGPYLATH
jgi:hypothetical protein